MFLLYIGAKSRRLINYRDTIYFSCEDTLLLSVIPNRDGTTTCSLYDLENIEDHMKKCVKLNKSYAGFISKIFFFSVSE